MFDLTGKLALITGASRGLGFAIAKGLSQHGATVILNGRNPKTLDESAEKLPTKTMRRHMIFWVRWI